MPRLALCLATNLLVVLALAASGCAPDVVGGTRPVEDDCSFGCEVEQEDPASGTQQGAGTGATASTTTTTAGQGGAGGEGVGGGSSGTSGEGGAGGAGGAGGTGGAGGAGGA